MQRDGLGVLGHIKVYHDSTVKGKVGEVGFQSQVIVPRDDVGGEELSPAHVKGARGLGGASVPAHVVSPE
jgi:hypothetical protein